MHLQHWPHYSGGEKHELVWWKRKGRTRQGHSPCHLCADTTEPHNHSWTESAGHSWNSWASCDQRDWTEKPHNQPAISTGFVFIHPLCNPSGLAEQLFGTTLNTWCSNGSYKQLLIPVVIFFFQTSEAPEGLSHFHVTFHKKWDWKCDLCRGRKTLMSALLYHL